MIRFCSKLIVWLVLVPAMVAGMLMATATVSYSIPGDTGNSGLSLVKRKSRHGDPTSWVLHRGKRYWVSNGNMYNCFLQRGIRVYELEDRDLDRRPDQSGRHAACGSSVDQPIGSLDGVQVRGDNEIRVTGWAIDRNVAWAHTAVRVYVGSEVHDLGLARRSRPDVARSFKTAGGHHGFDSTFATKRTGRVEVCAYAINIGPGRNQKIGCKTVVVRQGIPSEARSNRGALVKMLSRPDNASWLAVGGKRYWIPNGGVYECLRRKGVKGPVYLSNIDLDRLPDQIGQHAACGKTHNPVGKVDEIVAGNRGRVRVRGWAYDPNVPKAALRLYVRVGGGPVRELGYVRDKRPDVGNAHPAAGPYHGFNREVSTTKVGRQRVCVVARGLGPGNDKTIGCKDVQLSDRVGPAVDDRGAIVKMSQNPGGTAWLAARGKRFWIPNGGVYECLKASGVNGPRFLSNDDLNTLRDQPGQHAACSRNNEAFGAVELVNPEGNNRVRVRGWTIDPNVKTLPVKVYVKVGREPAKNIGVAGRPTNSVPAEHRSAGVNHGFDAVVSVAGKGRQQVCVIARAIGPGVDKNLGCRLVNMPESAQAGYSTAGAIVKMAQNPDATSWLAVRGKRYWIPDGNVYNCLRKARVSGPLYLSNADLDKLSDQKGSHAFCGSNKPIGHVDFVRPISKGQLHLAGWAFDPNVPKASVRYYVRMNGSAPRHYAVADRRRDDVARAHKNAGSDHGFDHIIRTGVTGRQRICLYAEGLGPGGDTEIGCQTVLMADKESAAHSHDGEIVKMAEKPDVASWFAVRGRRYWIPDGGIFQCLKASGVKGPTGLSNKSLDQLPDMNGKHAACGKHNNPIGRLESAVPLGGGKVRIRGWMYDPNVPSLPLLHSVKIGTEKTVGLGESKLRRNDVAGNHKSAGPWHGFDTVVKTRLSGHQLVCVTGSDVGPGRDTQIGCKHVNLPDALPRTAEDPGIIVKMAQKPGDNTSWLVVGAERYWIPDAKTYNCLVKAGARGPLYLTNADLDKRRDVRGQHASCDGANNPVGGVDEIKTGIGKLHVRAWAADINVPTRPVHLFARVDGKVHHLGRAGRPGHNGPKRVPGAGTAHHFVGDITGLKSGFYDVCIYAQNVGPGKTVSVGCKKVAVASKATGHAPAPGVIVKMAQNPANPTSWLAVAGKRYWIPDAKTYACLKKQGAEGPVFLMNSDLDSIPDLNKVEKTNRHKAACSSGSGSPTAEKLRITAAANGKIRIKGKIWDPSIPSIPLSLEVFVGEKPRNDKAERVTLRKGGRDSLVDTVQDVQAAGGQNVCVRARNVGPGLDTWVWCEKVTLRSDNQRFAPDRGYIVKRKDDRNDPRSWYLVSGRRYHIPDGGTYECLRKNKVSEVIHLSDRELDDYNVSGDPAKCEGHNNKDNPVGSLSDVTVQDGRGIVVGWAHDVNAPTTPLSIFADVRKVGQRTTTRVKLGTAQAMLSHDRSKAYKGIKTGSGFRLALPRHLNGQYEVCVWAANIGPGEHTRVGCQKVKLVAKAAGFRAGPATGYAQNDPYTEGRCSIQDFDHGKWGKFSLVGAGQPQHVVLAKAREGWLIAGGPRGPLGCPLGPQRPDGALFVQQFEGGRVYIAKWAPSGVAEMSTMVTPAQCMGTSPRKEYGDRNYQTADEAWIAVQCVSGGVPEWWDSARAKSLYEQVQAANEAANKKLSEETKRWLSPSSSAMGTLSALTVQVSSYKRADGTYVVQHSRYKKNYGFLARILPSREVGWWTKRLGPALIFVEIASGIDRLDPTDWHQASYTVAKTAIGITAGIAVARFAIPGMISLVTCGPAALLCAFALIVAGVAVSWLIAHVVDGVVDEAYRFAYKKADKPTAAWPYCGTQYPVGINEDGRCPRDQKSATRFHT